MTAGAAEPRSVAWLTDHLDAVILDGRLRPGDRLPSERELAGEHGLSRPMVREALGRVAERGLIDVQPGRGAYVRAVQPSDAARPLERLYQRQAVTPRALVEARAMLEGDAAALAAQRATADDLRRLKGLLARFDAARSTIQRAALDLAFHEALVGVAGNPVIETMFASIRRPILQQMLRSLADDQVTRVGVPDHGQILAAIRQGDAEAAREAAVGHMTVALARYGGDLDRPLRELAEDTVRDLLGPGIRLDDLLQPQER